MRKLFASTLLVAGLAIPAMAATGTGAAASTTQGANDKTIVETAAADRRFTTLVSLVKRAGLADALSGETKLTVFAPTNAAFRKVPKATLQKLQRDRALLRRVLYHVVAGDVKAAQVVKLRAARTLAGPSVRIRVRDGNVYLNNARTKVLQTDIAATNGTIHVINRVLLPPAR
jgi:uncharacterized surface protein with fasciclin (FAS1) repeats